MADQQQLAVLRQGVNTWNAWRNQNRDIHADLSGAPLARAHLLGAHLLRANLSRADLSGANLAMAYLAGANLSGANLSGAVLSMANLAGADLSGAHFAGADLSGAHFAGANLSNTDLADALLTRAELVGANLSKSKGYPNLFGADLSRALLSGANLSGIFSGADLSDADLSEATLSGANLSDTNLTGANLSGANLAGTNLGAANLALANLSGAALARAELAGALLVRTNLMGADLTGCRVYGISAWDLKQEGMKQESLIITPLGQPEITVDNIEVAQFIYLLLNNERIRHVIDTITSKVILILGRFTDERKAVLDALREELRQRDYTPVLFDFDKPASKDLTGTIQTLANMARFIIADLTDPRSVPHELAMVVPTTPVPVQPVLLEGQREYGMFVDLRRRHHWVLEPYSYASPERLIADLSELVIVPAEAKARELRGGVPPPTE